MKVSVIAATYNRKDLLLRSLETWGKNSIDGKIGFPVWQYILLDDGSEEDVSHKAINTMPSLPFNFGFYGFNVLRLNVPHTGWRDGYPLCNLGALFATGDIVVITHPEIMVPPDFLTEVLKFFDAAPAHPRPVLYFKPYWIPRKAQTVIDDAWDTPGKPLWQSHLAYIQNLPDFWAHPNPGEMPGMIPGRDYSNKSMCEKWGAEWPDFYSWVCAAMRREDFYWWGGFRNTRRWGLVDVDQRARLEALATCGEVSLHVHPSLMVYHQFHESTRSDEDWKKIWEAHNGLDYAIRTDDANYVKAQVIRDCRRAGGIYSIVNRED